MTRVVFAPNWLGDAVMALPAVADLHRHHPEARIIVAARAPVAPIFGMVPGVAEVVELRGPGALREDARRLRALGASTAILFPNSIRTALTAALAGIPERCGYRRGVRGVLLTRSVPAPARGTHQVDAYRHLAAALGVANGPREPRVDLDAAARDGARAWLRDHGWDGTAPLVGFGPGAAYGGAKRGPPDRVARVVAHLAAARGAACVLVGSVADAPVTAAVAAGAARLDVALAPGRVIDLAGRTTLAQLAGVLASCQAFVSNDSGAMHLAAAVGTRVVAVFGPTNERETAPVPRPGTTAALIAGSAFCRPCGLRECPIDHRCLTSVSVDSVIQAVSEGM